MIHAPALPRATPLSGLTLVVLQVAAATGQVPLDAYIRTQMQQGHAPGLAACIVQRNHVLWARGFGWAEIETQRPVTPDTLFKLASVSKTVTATALMQLYEEGCFALDDNVDDYLPFPVRNPHHPQAPLTFRQVLTHTASIRDNWAVMYALLTEGDPQVPLFELIPAYFTPGGYYYDAAQNFYSAAPGAERHYANLGFALAGYLVEVLAGEPFETRCQEALFAPLEMSESSWYQANLDLGHHAMPYYWDSAAHAYVPYGYLSFPDVPAGELHTSVRQLANFLSAHLNASQFGDRSILSPAGVAEMHRVQFPAIAPQQGLAFYYAQYGGDTLLGHTGVDYGFNAACFLRPCDGTGAIVLVNGDAYGTCLNVLTRLFDEASLVATRPRGDLNCDGAVKMDDVNPFVLALSDADAYAEYFDGDPAPLCDRFLADVNEDGAVNLGDINAFVEILDCSAT